MKFSAPRRYTWYLGNRNRFGSNNICTITADNSNNYILTGSENLRSTLESCWNRTKSKVTRSNYLLHNQPLCVISAGPVYSI